MPRGDTVFEAGDEVLAMVTPESEDEVRRILTGVLSRSHARSAGSGEAAQLSSS